MANLKIDAQVREIAGTKVKQLRLQGIVPVVVYGKGLDAQNLQVLERNLDYVLHHGGSSRLVELDVNGGSKHNVLVRAVQRHPINHRLMHADFYAVRMDEKQEVHVSVVGHGKPLALTSDRIVLQRHESITVSALPADLPAVIDVDLTNLSTDHPITVADLPKLPGVEYVIDPHDNIFAMVTSVDSAGEGAAEAAATTAEPEVVKKGKPDEEA